MSYLLDKKIKRKKIIWVVASIFICLVLFYFRGGVWNGLSYASHKIFRPVLVLGNAFGEKLEGVRSFFVSQNSLYRENQNLKSKIAENEARMANYDSLFLENLNLKDTLGRKDTKLVLVLAAILAKPNRSPYDTLVIDAGLRQGLKVGGRVFALGNVPIGRISDVYPDSSKVILFSNSGERTQIVLTGESKLSLGGNTFLEVVGRGGGNFEMIMPRDLTLVKGDQVVLPGIVPYVVAIVETIISDPRDPFTKALLVSPVNVQEIKFVEVEK